MGVCRWVLESMRRGERERLREGGGNPTFYVLEKKLNKLIQIFFSLN